MGSLFEKWGLPDRTGPAFLTQLLEPGTRPRAQGAGHWPRVMLHRREIEPTGSSAALRKSAASRNRKRDEKDKIAGAKTVHRLRVVHTCGKRHNSSIPAYGLAVPLSLGCLLHRHTYLDIIVGIQPTSSTARVADTAQSWSSGLGPKVTRGSDRPLFPNPPVGIPQTKGVILGNACSMYPLCLWIVNGR